MIKRKRVLYLTPDGLTDPLGQSQILPYLYRLSDEYDLLIISLEKPEKLREQGTMIESICSQKAISWIPLVYHNFPPLLSSVYDIFCMYRTALAFHVKKPFDIIHCRSYVTSLVGLRLKRKYGLKFIFDMRGFWADERREGEIWNLNNPLYKLAYRYFKKKEKKFLEWADHVVVLTESARDVIMEWGTEYAKIAVIPCCVDMSLFDPKSVSEQEKMQARSLLGFSRHDFILIYLGSWGTWYLTNEMLLFFETVKKRIPNAHFLILSPDKIDLTHTSLRESIVVRSVTRNEVPLFIALSNAAVLFIKNSFSKKGSSATKMGEIMAMNVPVVTNTEWGDIQGLQKKIHGLIVIEDFNRVELAIEKMQEPYDGIRESIQNEFDIAVGVDRYKSIYSRLSHS